ncbi:MAG: tRNA preQ1(34) S-adenosylmethionine ribosyltransferase-isomerase QueA [Microgenomates group bacterium]
MNKRLYDYYLPKKLLAKKPASPRDHSKIFIYETKTDKIFFDKFLNIDKYLPKNSFLVLNNTQVVPARVTMKKITGGKVEALFLINEINKFREEKLINILVDRKVKIGDKLFFNQEDFVAVIDQNKNIFQVKFNFSYEKLFYLLEKYGVMPVPLYLKDTPLSKDKLLKKYQTVFAQKKGSVAAPTASLHFTNRVFKKLKRMGIKKYFVTLHVGMGTFAPITEENLKTKKLHQEYYQVEKEVWERILKEKNEGKKLVAVGTTTVRTLESFAQYENFVFLQNNIFKTDLFIFPPFEFKMVDVLITNFHLPNSSLMMLVEAFLQFKKAKKHLVDLYNIAIKNEFRFYSFGDSMIIK